MIKQLFLVLAAVLAVGTVSAYTCFDSDGGNAPYVKGRCVDNIRSYSDYCAGSGSVEFSCDSNRCVKSVTACGSGCAVSRCNPAVCGDGVCEGAESCSSCRADCAAGCGECEDGVDNDNDGRVDLADSGCAGYADTDESDCGDGVCEGAEGCDLCSADCGACPCAESSFVGSYCSNKDSINPCSPIESSILSPNVRTDSSVDFVGWVSADFFGVRWDGFVKSGAAGSYTFYATVNDGVKLWVNDVSVINVWSDRRSAETMSGSVTLPYANSWYPVRMEYYYQKRYRSESPTARLEFSGPGIARHVANAGSYADEVCNAFS